MAFVFTWPGDTATSGGTPAPNRYRGVCDRVCVTTWEIVGDGVGGSDAVATSDVESVSVPDSVIDLMCDSSPDAVGASVVDGVRGGAGVGTGGAGVAGIGVGAGVTRGGGRVGGGTVFDTVTAPVSVTSSLRDGLTVPAVAVTAGVRVGGGESDAVDDFVGGGVTVAVTEEVRVAEPVGAGVTVGVTGIEAVSVTVTLPRVAMASGPLPVGVGPVSDTSAADCVALTVAVVAVGVRVRVGNLEPVGTRSSDWLKVALRVGGGVIVTVAVGVGVGTALWVGGGVIVADKVGDSPVADSSVEFVAVIVGAGVTVPLAVRVAVSVCVRVGGGDTDTLTVIVSDTDSEIATDGVPVGGGLPVCVAVSSAERLPLAGEPVSERVADAVASFDGVPCDFDSVRLGVGAGVTVADTDTLCVAVRDRVAAGETVTVGESDVDDEWVIELEPDRDAAGDTV